jgi:hypothetical protein
MLPFVAAAAQSMCGCRLWAVQHGGRCSVVWRSSSRSFVWRLSSCGVAQRSSSHGIAWASCSRGVARRLSLWHCVAGIFARCCAGVVLRSVTRPSSSRGVVWRRLRVAWGLLSHGRRLHVPSHGYCLCVPVVVVIITAWLPRGKGTYLPTPPQTAGAVQGRGAMAMPLRRHKPCSCANERGAGHKRGGGGQRAIGGRGRRRGHVPSCAPANGGGCAGEGSKAAALPLRDSGANLVRTRTGGRAQRGRQRAIRGGGGRGHIPSRAPENGRGCAEEGHKRGGSPDPA